MRRVIPHFLLGLLVIGLMGPITAYSWRMTVSETEAEETQESVGEEFTLGHGSARLAGSRLPPPRPPRSAERARTSRPVRVFPPVQGVAPRPVAVWRPSNPVPDEEPFSG